VACCPPNELFALANEKRIWHYDESADAASNHCSKRRLDVDFSSRRQSLQTLLKSVGCSSNVSRVKLEVAIAWISERGDRIDVKVFSPNGTRAGPRRRLLLGPAVE